MKHISLILAQLAVAILTAACAQQSAIETTQAVQPPSVAAAVPQSLPPLNSAQPVKIANPSAQAGVVQNSTLTSNRKTSSVVPPIARSIAITPEPDQSRIAVSKSVSAPTPPVAGHIAAVNPRPPITEALPTIDTSKRAVYLKNLRACLDQMPDCNLSMLTVDDYKRAQTTKPAPDTNSKSAAYLKNLRFCLDHDMTACNLAMLTGTDFRRVQAALEPKAHDTAAEVAKTTCVKGYYRKSGAYVQGYCRNAKL
jgi:hypothetical protein